MKTVEEKAKAYDEAIERVKDFIEKQNPPAFDKNLIGTIFPELKEESKDERIRRELITLIQGCDKGCYTTISPSRIKEYTAWLEKQKQVKNTNKEDEEVRRYIIRTMEQKDINVPMVRKAIAWLNKYHIA